MGLLNMIHGALFGAPEPAQEEMFAIAVPMTREGMAELEALRESGLILEHDDHFKGAGQVGDHVLIRDADAFVQWAADHPDVRYVATDYLMTFDPHEWIKGAYDPT